MNSGVFQSGEKSETNFKLNQNKPQFAGRGRKNVERCFELTWNEIFCLLGYLILCKSVFFKNRKKKKKILIKEKCQFE